MLKKGSYVLYTMVVVLISIKSKFLCKIAPRLERAYPKKLHTVGKGMAPS